MNCYYDNKISNFLKDDSNKIQGIINNRNQLFDAGIKTQKSWQIEINILKNQLREFEGDIIFEYTIPRIGNRIDVVVIIHGILFLLEYKTNDKQHRKSTDDQVMDYALDLKNFHKESRDRYIVPISVATDAPYFNYEIAICDDKIFRVIRANKDSIKEIIESILKEFSDTEIDAKQWINSEYFPTPTIIESARYMYANHDVKDISRSDASAENLTHTTNSINKIIENCRKFNEKAICFITGVPGAGKTLAGLNIATQNRNRSENEKSNSVFLSGNGPLVTVLQEALAKDLKYRENVKITQARRQTISFINNIHKFRDNYITNNDIPFENIVIFDEAQRTWTKDQLSKFMKEKKNTPNFQMSEPECLLEIMDRHKNWCVVVCLVGGGQEINTGEAGIQAWIDALRKDFSSWKLFISDRLNEVEYVGTSELTEIIKDIDYVYKSDLHLGVSLRSFRSEKLASFVHAVLDEKQEKAKDIYNEIQNYPILITRDINKAKNWVKNIKRGTEKVGVLASSNAIRLRPYGIWVKSNINVCHWFLSDEIHPESSNALEQTCTEFDIQGLELDYAVVAWDGDFRIKDGIWNYYNFRGDKWERINKSEKRRYKLNAYRVLLTRARQGMIIFVPSGVDKSIDHTRDKKIYDETYNYLLGCGFQSID
ncbi:DUF2075 domain-containing protein [Atopobacter phocae]|uniref:DUF2075 domain-containing protein n=1 Tax=Atopobacter phocae TaxID=136492 RepID=UPI000471377D|nr:DUF2075 domain-containing protein [Atopobacter phocae]